MSTRHQRWINGLLFLCIVASHSSFAQSTGGEHPKSLVLKDREPEHNPFHFDIDHSRMEMWTEFMLVKDANSGDPVAQHELGLRYLMGKGFPADTPKAVYWVRKAADQNLLSARYNLGIFLNNGLSVPWNPFEAFEHFKFSAEHGMVEAEYVYGLLLTDNLTVPRNYAQAYHWIKIASDSGYAPATEVLAEFRQRGYDRLEESSKTSARDAKTKSSHASSAPGPKSAPQLHPVIVDFTSDSVVVPGKKELLQEALVDANPKLKEQLLSLSIDSTNEEPDTTGWEEIHRSAEAGNPEALTLLGHRYETGSGVRADVVSATVYYLRAVRYESASAAMRLWKMTQSDNYFATLKKMVDANAPKAQFSWAGLALFGFDRQLTEGQAIDFLNEAAHKDFPPAIVELGIRYYTGASVKQDRDHALELFDRAARLGSREALLRAAMMRLNVSRTAVPDSVLLNVLSSCKEDGSVLAEEILGYFYSAGVGVPKNIPESVMYYRKAAQRGSTVAYGALRNLYDEIRPPDAKFQIQN